MTALITATPAAARITSAALAASIPPMATTGMRRRRSTSAMRARPIASPASGLAPGRVDGAGADVVRAAALRRPRQLRRLRADADQEARRGRCAARGHGQVVLAQVRAVRAGGERHVHAVVHAEQRARRARSASSARASATCSRAGWSFAAELDAGAPAAQRRAHDVHEVAPLAAAPGR